jgi:Flp pilus assembly protein TadD
MDRRRLLAAVAVALAGSLVVVVAALAGRSSSRHAPSAQTAAPSPHLPPLVLDLPARYGVRASGAARIAALRRLGNPARDPLLALAITSAAIGANRRDEAAAALADATRRLGSGDARVAAARAILLYDPRNPQPADDALQAIAAERPEDPFPQFERGLVLFFAGRGGEAEQAFTAARALDPDSPYASRADDLLHRNMRSGYPFWLADEPLPAGTLAQLRRRALARPDDALAQLALANALQRDHRSQAEEAAQRAVAADPTNLDAQVAVAVLGFSKDDPAASVGALGNLVRTFPAAASPVFHIGVCLIWLENPAQARNEFEKAARLEPDSPVGRTAAAIVRRLR